MSSSPENENFEQLQKLMKLKRYEQPPPRYFNDFSSQVLARLQSPAPEADPSWWARLGLGFGFQPALACVGGVLACGLLIYGVMFSMLGHDEPTDLLVGDSSGIISTAIGSERPAGLVLTLDADEIRKENSTNPVAPFGDFRLKPIPVSFPDNK